MSQKYRGLKCYEGRAALLHEMRYVKEGKKSLG